MMTKCKTFDAGEDFYSQLPTTRMTGNFLVVERGKEEMLEKVGLLLRVSKSY